MIFKATRDRLTDGKPPGYIDCLLITPKECQGEGIE
jgi:hypothetical protein